jgi:hypothetical protein
VKRLPSIREIYRGVRKPVPPPSKVQSDRREEIRRKEDRKYVDRELRRGGRHGRDEE